MYAPILVKTKSPGVNSVLKFSELTFSEINTVLEKFIVGFLISLVLMKGMPSSI